MIKLKLDTNKNMKYFEHFIEVNNIKQYVLAYLKPESDKVLVHLHGGPGEANSVFVPLSLPEFLPCNLIFFDQRGAGKTQAMNNTCPKEITMENLIKDLYELIQFIKNELKIPKVVLVGHSFGTILAHDFIKQYPNEALGIISIGTVISILKSEKFNMDELSQIIMQKGMDNDKKTIEELQKANYPYVANQEDFIPNLMKFRKLFWTYRPSHSNRISKFKLLCKSYTMHLKDLKWVNNVKLITQNNGNLLNYITNYDISDVDEYPVPIYFINGEHDYVCPTKIVEEHFKKLKNEKTEMYIIPFADHSPQVDNTKEYWNVVNAILFNLFNSPLKG